jgi:hypothetical protein
MALKNNDEHIDTLHETLGFDIKDMTTKLYTIKRGAKIYGEKLDISDSGTPTERVIVFDHVDGMYSYCEVRELDGDTTLNKDGTPAIIHLNASAPLVRYGDGYRIYKGKY